MKPTTWVAWGGLVTAAVTAIAVAWQTYETRNHFRLTVMPMVLPHVSHGHLDEQWGIFLRNVGTGPAHVDYEAVTLDGQSTDMKEIVAAMIREGVLLPKPGLVSYMGLKQGSSLGAGDTKALLAVHPDAVPPSVSEQFGVFIHRRIDIRLEVCSVYKDCESVSTKEG